MNRFRVVLLLLGSVVLPAVADVCYVFFDGCGDLPVCEGSGWQQWSQCTKDYCEDSLTCLKDGGGTANQYISRTRDKKRKPTTGGGFTFCISSTYSQTYPYCCDCDGTIYPVAP